MADVIPFKAPPAKEPACSFCKTPVSKCKKFFSNGADKAICEKCLQVCQQRLKETDGS